MKFTDLVKKVEDKIKEDPSVINELIQIAQKVYSSTFKKAIEQEYCAVFDVDEKAILKLIPKFGITTDELVETFNKDLGFPKTTYMYGNPYYHILLVLYYIFTKNNNKKLAQTALFLILAKMWNGRKYKYIKYCNKSIMDYVLAYKTSGKNLISKYKNPLDLVLRYFVPTIDSKYSEYIMKDYKKIKLLFAQCFARLEQLFHNIYKTGLADLYFKVYNSGEALNTINISNNEEENIFNIESRNTELMKLIDLVITNLTLTKLKYPPEFIQYINQKTKVSKKSIEIFAEELHNVQYKDIYRELFIIMFNKLGVYNIETLCKYQNIIPIIDKTLISSKHNKDVEEFKKYLEKIINDILMRKTGKTLDDYSAKISILRVVAYLLAYSLVNTICKIEHKG